MSNNTEIFPLKLLAGSSPAQNCLSFTNPCINSFVPTSVTREYNPKVLERLHLLQYISAHLKNTLPWATWETQCLNLFRADFRSFLVARSRKSIKCVLKTLLRRSMHALLIRPQKANGLSCSPQQWHPRRRVYDCLSNSYRPGLTKTFGRGPHKLLQNSMRAGHLASCYFFKICYILPNQHIFRKYIIFSLLAKCIAAWWNGFTGRIWPETRCVESPNIDRRVVTAHTIAWVQHQRWTVVIYLRRHGHNFLSRHTVIWRPARGTSQHRYSHNTHRTFHEKPGHILSRGRQNMSILLWHAPRILGKFAEESKFGL